VIRRHGDDQIGPFDGPPVKRPGEMPAQVDVAFAHDLDGLGGWRRILPRSDPGRLHDHAVGVPFG
jgi:hypothetical protein